MRATYDKEADAMSIDLVPGGIRARTVKTTAPGILLHFDKAGHLIELEVIGASEYLPRTELETLSSPAEWLTLSEAAKDSGLSMQTLKVQIHNKRLPGQKRGGIWMVTRAALWTYLENRGPTGDRPASRKGRRTRREQQDRKKKKAPAPTG